MLTKALGMIETYSLTAAIEAADAATKSADVELVGYELAKGGGLVTVKLLGQVAAVQSAVAAGKAAASAVNRVVSVSVIPRPNEQLDRMVYNNQTVGYSEPKPAPRKTAKAAATKTSTTNSNTNKKEEEK